MVEQLSAERPDESLDVRVLPRAAVRRAYILDVAAIEEGSNAMAVEAVVVAEEVARFGAVGRGIAKQACAVTVTPSTLPADWSYDELGAPPIPGSIVVADGVFTLTGCSHAMTSW